ncbi:MAG: hypothetical protein K8R21_12530 [Leptospira sp.]|nr:hypothetical protein [Leptospira sp.]
MKIIVLIVLCCAGCKKPKDPYLFSIPDKNKPVLLSYGEKPDSPMSSFSDKDTWGPVLTEVDSRICLGSIGQNFKAREWGPYFGACFEKSDDSKSLLTDSISILNSKDLPKIRPEGNLLLRNNPVHLDFETAREIENGIEDSGKKRFFIGDPVLFAYFSKKPYFVHEDSFSTIGDTAKHIETSFAAYYFSFVVLNGKVRLIFPPGNLETSVTDIRYLVLDLSGAEIVSQFESFLDEIENKNREFSEECSIGKIRLTEILNESSSPTGRFLEFRNESTDHSTCLKNVLLSSSKDSYPAYFTSGFIFPGATKLIVDSGSRLPGTIVKNLKWTELKARSKIRILNLQNEEEWILPDSLIFKSGNVFFSLKKNPDSGCSMSSILYSTGLAICADPGIDLSAESILTGSVCPSEKFSLTELNPIGLLVNGEIEKSGKFMELKYSGKEDCDLSGNTIRLGEAQIPFFKKGMILKEGDHLVLGDEKYFPGIRNILPVNLDFLKAESRIDIADNVKNNLLFPGIPVTDHFILESPQHEIYSLRFKRGHSGHHMRYISSFIRSDLSKNHYMSPGEADPDLQENVTGKINEISWMGSYQNGVSKPGDKFLEIVSMGTGGLSIRTEISGILLPAGPCLEK